MRPMGAARSNRVPGALSVAWVALAAATAATLSPCHPAIAVDARQNPRTPIAGKPDDSRFTATVLVPGGELDEPMVLSVLPDERVLIIERKGGFKVYDPVTEATTLIATIPVNTKYYSPAGRVTEAEEGLFGLTIDPKFSENRWIYMKYADPQVPKHVLARWELRRGARPRPRQGALALVESSKRVRAGASGAARALLSHRRRHDVGSPGQPVHHRRQQHGRRHHRRAARQRGVRRSAQRGEHERPARQDPAYSSGAGWHATPFLPAICSLPGRPARALRSTRWATAIRGASRSTAGPGLSTGARWGRRIGRPNGPTPYDEFNQASGPGFFGLPYFVGENEGFQFRDFVNNRFLPAKDPLKPTNTSVNNTGLRELPPAQPAFIAYSYEPSEKFPELGSGAHSAVGGPIYHRADFAPIGEAAFSRLLRGQMADRRLRARLDHGHHDGRAEQLRVDGAVSAELSAARDHRHAVRARRRPLCPRLRQHVVREERRQHAREDRVQRGKSPAEGGHRGQHARRHAAVSGEPVGVRKHRPGRRSAQVRVADRAALRIRADVHRNQTPECHSLRPECYTATLTVTDSIRRERCDLARHRRRQHTAGHHDERDRAQRDVLPAGLADRLRSDRRRQGRRPAVVRPCGAEHRLRAGRLRPRGVSSTIAAGRSLHALCGRQGVHREE